MSDHQEVTYNCQDHVYKTIDGLEMICRCYQPSKTTQALSKGAVLFYFGGGWAGGSIDQFAKQCHDLTRQGLTCCVVDYRVKSRHGVTPFQCIEDCKDSVAWLIDQAEAFDIDPRNLVLIGASAGGHIALTAVLQNPGLMSPYVKGLVLYNPVTDTSEAGFGHTRFMGKGLEASPIHLLRSGLPKTLIFHGTGDHTVPFENTERFVRESRKLGNSCDLVPYQGADHGFFNYNQSPSHYKTTMASIEAFLRDLAILA